MTGNIDENMLLRKDPFSVVQFQVTLRLHYEMGHIYDKKNM